MTVYRCKIIVTGEMFLTTYPVLIILEMCIINVVHGEGDRAKTLLI